MKDLTADEANEIRKAATAAISKVHSKHAGRARASITEVENPNYAIRKSDAERAVSKLHSGHNAGVSIAKREPGTDAGASGIAALHSDSAFTGRNVSGNATLVAKLAGAVAVALQKDFSSAAEAKRELKKLIDAPAPDVTAIAKRIETGSSNDVPRNQTTLKSGKGAIGKVTLIEKKGADYPYEIECDGYYHSAYPDKDRALETFKRLTAATAA